MAFRFVGHAFLQDLPPPEHTFEIESWLYGLGVQLVEALSRDTHALQAGEGIPADAILRLIRSMKVSASPNIMSLPASRALLNLLQMSLPAVPGSRPKIPGLEVSVLLRLWGEVSSWGVREVLTRMVRLTMGDRTAPDRSLWSTVAAMLHDCVTALDGGPMAERPSHYKHALSAAVHVSCMLPESGLPFRNGVPDASDVIADVAKTFLAVLAEPRAEAEARWQALPSTAFGQADLYKRRDAGPAASAATHPVLAQQAGHCAQTESSVPCGNRQPALPDWPMILAMTLSFRMLANDAAYASTDLEAIVLQMVEVLLSSQHTAVDDDFSRVHCAGPMCELIAHALTLNKGLLARLTSLDVLQRVFGILATVRSQQPVTPELAAYADRNLWSYNAFMKLFHSHECPQGVPFAALHLVNVLMEALDASQHAAAAAAVAHLAAAVPKWDILEAVELSKVPVGSALWETNIRVYLQFVGLAYSRVATEADPSLHEEVGVLKVKSMVALAAIVIKEFEAHPRLILTPPPTDERQKVERMRNVLGTVLVDWMPILSTPFFQNTALQTQWVELMQRVRVMKAARRILTPPAIKALQAAARACKAWEEAEASAQAAADALLQEEAEASTAVRPSPRKKKGKKAKQRAALMRQGASAADESLAATVTMQSDGSLALAGDADGGRSQAAVANVTGTAQQPSHALPADQDVQQAAAAESMDVSTSGHLANAQINPVTGTSPIAGHADITVSASAAGASEPTPTASIACQPTEVAGSSNGASGPGGGSAASIRGLKVACFEDRAVPQGDKSLTEQLLAFLMEATSNEAQPDTVELSVAKMPAGPLESEQSVVRSLLSLLAGALCGKPPLPVRLSIGLHELLIIWMQKADGNAGRTIAAVLRAESLTPLVIVKLLAHEDRALRDEGATLLHLLLAPRPGEACPAEAERARGQLLTLLLKPHLATVQHILEGTRAMLLELAEAPSAKAMELALEALKLADTLMGDAAGQFHAQALGAVAHLACDLEFRLEGTPQDQGLCKLFAALSGVSAVDKPVLVAALQNLSRALSCQGQRVLETVLLPCIGIDGICEAWGHAADSWPLRAKLGAVLFSIIRQKREAPETIANMSAICGKLAAMLKDGMQAPCAVRMTACSHIAQAMAGLACDNRHAIAALRQLGLLGPLATSLSIALDGLEAEAEQHGANTSGEHVVDFASECGVEVDRFAASICQLVRASDYAEAGNGVQDSVARFAATLLLQKSEWHLEELHTCWAIPHPDAKQLRLREYAQLMPTMCELVVHALSHCSDLPARLAGPAGLESAVSCLEVRAHMQEQFRRAGAEVDFGGYDVGALVVMLVKATKQHTGRVELHRRLMDPISWVGKTMENHMLKDLGSRQWQLRISSACGFLWELGTLMYEPRHTTEAHSSAVSDSCMAVCGCVLQLNASLTRLLKDGDSFLAITARNSSKQEARALYDTVQQVSGALVTSLNDLVCHAAGELTPFFADAAFFEVLRELCTDSKPLLKRMLSPDARRTLEGMLQHLKESATADDAERTKAKQAAASSSPDAAADSTPSSPPALSQDPAAAKPASAGICTAKQPAERSIGAAASNNCAQNSTRAADEHATAGVSGAAAPGCLTAEGASELSGAPPASTGPTQVLCGKSVHISGMPTAQATICSEGHTSLLIRNLLLRGGDQLPRPHSAQHAMAGELLNVLLSPHPGQEGADQAMAKLRAQLLAPHMGHIAQRIISLAQSEEIGSTTQVFWKCACHLASDSKSWPAMRESRAFVGGLRALAVAAKMPRPEAYSLVLTFISRLAADPQVMVDGATPESCSWRTGAVPPEGFAELFAALQRPAGPDRDAAVATWTHLLARGDPVYKLLTQPKYGVGQRKLMQAWGVDNWSLRLQVAKALGSCASWDDVSAGSLVAMVKDAKAAPLTTKLPVCIWLAKLIFTLAGCEEAVVAALRAKGLHRDLASILLEALHKQIAEAGVVGPGPPQLRSMRETWLAIGMLAGTLWMCTLPSDYQEGSSRLQDVVGKLGHAVLVMTSDADLHLAGEPPKLESADWESHPECHPIGRHIVRMPSIYLLLGQALTHCEPIAARFATLDCLMRAFNQMDTAVRFKVPAEAKPFGKGLRDCFFHAAFVVNALLDAYKAHSRTALPYSVIKPHLALLTEMHGAMEARVMRKDVGSWNWHHQLSYGCKFVGNLLMLLPQQQRQGEERDAWRHGVQALVQPFNCLMATPPPVGPADSVRAAIVRMRDVASNLILMLDTLLTDHLPAGASHTDSMLVLKLGSQSAQKRLLRPDAQRIVGVHLEADRLDAQAEAAAQAAGDALLREEEAAAQQTAAAKQKKKASKKNKGRKADDRPSGNEAAQPADSAADAMKGSSTPEDVASVSTPDAASGQPGSPETTAGQEAAQNSSSSKPGLSSLEADPAALVVETNKQRKDRERKERAQARRQAEAAAAASACLHTQPQSQFAAQRVAGNQAEIPETGLGGSMQPHLSAQEMECPITQDTMTDPVIAGDGHTYERSAIELWFSNHDTSPMTNEVVSDKDLIPNIIMRRLIQSYTGRPGARQ
ncbi:hypothetical protein WJX72_008079 [[Myrmecia] bisecta]|uniref:U-box domain-containing protein n=1 Tax=[Myrmecia] bisecta TaxID=41462 RepID=A0AAW1R871_9CHLO